MKKLTKRAARALVHAVILAIFAFALNMFFGVVEGNVEFCKIFSASCNFAGFMLQVGFAICFLCDKQLRHLWRDFTRESQRPTEEADEGWDE